jgi:hypothetical protein
VGPFSRAWRFFEWNLRPSSFTPAQGHDRDGVTIEQGCSAQLNFFAKAYLGCRSSDDRNSYPVGIIRLKVWAISRLVVVGQKDIGDSSSLAPIVPILVIAGIFRRQLDRCGASGLSVWTTPARSLATVGLAHA